MSAPRSRAAAVVAVCALALLGCGAAARSRAPAGSTAAARSAGAARARSAGAAPARSAPDGDWRTFAYGPGRSGVGPAGTGITAGNLRRLRARIVSLDGTVDSAAIQLHDVRVRGRVRDVAIVTTTYGRTLAFDPGTGAHLWEFRPAAAAALQGSTQITTAGPVADPSRRYVYAASPDGFVHKLSLVTGGEVRGPHWPARVTWNPHREKLPSALSVSGSSVVVVTDGYYGDAPSYQGHVVLLDRASGRVRAVFNSLCSNRHRLIDPPSSCPASDSGIWGRAGAVVEPGSGRILVATGNGPFNGSTDWGDSVLELSPGLRLLHNWTPGNQASLEQSDTDIGSTSPALLPPFGGRRLVVQGGKTGVLALLDLGRLNGTPGAAGPRSGGQLQFISTPGGAEMLTAPVVWSHGGREFLFVADDGGTAAYLLGDPERPRLHLAWKHGTSGTSPVLAGGLLYVYDERGGSLNVFDPTSGRRLISLPAGSGHWNSPIVIGGRVILPTGNANDHSGSGRIVVYHLPGR